MLVGRFGKFMTFYCIWFIFFCFAKIMAINENSLTNILELNIENTAPNYGFLTEDIFRISPAN